MEVIHSREGGEERLRCSSVDDETLQAMVVTAERKEDEKSLRKRMQMVAVVQEMHAAYDQPLVVLVRERTHPVSVLVGSLGAF